MVTDLSPSYILHDRIDDCNEINLCRMKHLSDGFTIGFIPRSGCTRQTDNYPRDGFPGHLPRHNDSPVIQSRSHRIQGARSKVYHSTTGNPCEDRGSRGRQREGSRCRGRSWRRQHPGILWYYRKHHPSADCAQDEHEFRQGTFNRRRTQGKIFSRPPIKHRLCGRHPPSGSGPTG